MADIKVSRSGLCPHQQMCDEVLPKTCFGLRQLNSPSEFCNRKHTIGLCIYIQSTLMPIFDLSRMFPAGSRRSGHLGTMFKRLFTWRLIQIQTMLDTTIGRDAGKATKKVPIYYGHGSSHQIGKGGMEWAPEPHQTLPDTT